MEEELKAEEKSIADDLSALNKKSKFLEKQYQEANSQLRDIVRSRFDSRPLQVEKIDTDHPWTFTGSFIAHSNQNDRWLLPCVYISHGSGSPLVVSIALHSSPSVAQPTISSLALERVLVSPNA